MSAYTFNRPSAALSTSNDLATFIAAAGKPVSFMHIKLKGAGTASAQNEVVLYRSSGGTTPGGAITLRPVSSDGAAAGCLMYTTWSVQPTLGVEVWRFSLNALADWDAFTALPGLELTLPSAGQYSLRSASGTSNVVLTGQLYEHVG
jgi:hypothetical protein